MANETKVTEEQQVLLHKWAEGTEFVLDIYDTPKRQFNVLAKLQGWEGGEEPWNTKWLKCFGAEYIWRAGMTAPTTLKTHAVDGEDAAGSSGRATPLPSDDGGSASDNDHGSNSDTGGGVWDQFEGFKSNCKASFNKEFWRLTLHLRKQGWTDAEIREQRVKLFEADFEAHYGKDVGSLADWQEFCRLCSIDPVPDTIVGCIEALEIVFVNIYDVLDHKRTGASIEPFPDFESFRHYTLDGKTYPLDRAKADTFLPVFLKVLNPHGERY